MTDETNSRLTARTAETVLRERRRMAIAVTLDLLEAGMPKTALRHITNSVFGEQARVAGIRVRVPE